MSRLPNPVPNVAGQSRLDLTSYHQDTPSRVNATDLLVNKLKVINSSEGGQEELARILVESAQQHPCVNDSIDQLYQRCLRGSTSHNTQDEEFPTRTLPPLAEEIRATPIGLPRQIAQESRPRLPIVEPTPTNLAVTRIRPTRADTNRTSTVPNQLPMRRVRSVDTLVDSLEGSKRLARSSLKDPMIGADSKSGARPTIPQNQPIHSSRSQFRSGNDIVNSEVDDGESEPGERLVDYSILVNKIKQEIGSHHWYDKEPQKDLHAVGKMAAEKVESILIDFQGHVLQYKSFRDRVRVLAAMREIITIVLQAKQPELVAGVRDKEDQYAITLKQAVMALTPQQLYQLRVLNNGEWSRELRKLIDAKSTVLAAEQPRDKNLLTETLEEILQSINSTVEFNGGVSIPTTRI